MAERWGTSREYARYICSQAKKIASEELRDSDAAMATAGEACLQIIQEGMASKRFSDRKIVLEAIKQYTMLVPGMRAPTEHTVRVDNTPNDLPTLIEIAKKLAQEQEDGVLLELGEDGVFE